jgi:hydroxypyruvate isomerase
VVRFCTDCFDLLYAWNFASLPTVYAMPKFAANLSMQFTELPFMQRFAAAARAGYRAVEFLFPYEFEAAAIRAELDAHGLQNVLFNLYPGDWAAGERGLAGLPGRQEEFRASVQQALNYAKVLGTPRLHVMAGLQPAGVAREACLQTYVANLRHACAQAAAHNVSCLIEPINTRDMPGYLLSLQADAHALRAEVGAPNLLVQMDLYHAQIMEGDLAVKLRRYLPHIGHVQIAGVPDRHEPDQGEVNYPYLFALLDELGYQGWVGCEYRPANGTEAGLGWMAAYVA